MPGPRARSKSRLNSLEEGAPNYDYIVGWLDTITIGHGQIHAANYVHDDPDPAKMQVSAPDPAQPSVRRDAQEPAALFHDTLHEQFRRVGH